MNKFKKHLRHYLTPHHRNNYRAKILHNSSLVILILLLFISSFSSVGIQKKFPSVLGISYSISSDEMLVYVNQARTEQGLPPLTMNPQLSDAARQKASDMFEKNYWAHFAPDGVSPWYFIKNAGYQYVYAGENLAKGFTTSSDVVTAWMNSPSHRENIVSDKYKDIGFAIVEGDLMGEETVLVVQMFGATEVTGTQTASVPEGESVEIAQAPQQPEPQTIAQVEEVIPTSTPIPTVIPPTPIPTAVIDPVVVATENQQTGGVATVASIGRDAIFENPVIDIQILTRILSITLVTVLLFAFVFDFFVIERKKIPRIVGHNLDHIFLIGIFILILLSQSTGGIL